MRESPGHEISKQESVSRVRRVRITGGVVWTLIGMAILIWGKPSGGQGPGLQETPSAQGQVLDQSRQRQAPAPPVPAGQLVPVAVTMDDGKLSVSLSEARFYDVMDAIAHQTGIQITFVGQASHVPLTESFSGLSLEDGLRRLLRGKNYLLMYAGTGAESRIARVLVISHPGEPVEDFGAQTPTVAEVIGEALNSQRFAETVKAAITAGGGATEKDQALEGTVAAELHSTFQRLLSEGGGATLVNARLQRLLQQQRQ
jgi:hypothetical protein